MKNSRTTIFYRDMCIRARSSSVSDLGNNNLRSGFWGLHIHIYFVIIEIEKHLLLKIMDLAINKFGFLIQSKVNG